MDPARNVLPPQEGPEGPRGTSRTAAARRALANLYPAILLLGVGALLLASGQRRGALTFGGLALLHLVLRAARLNRLPHSPKWPLLAYFLALAAVTGTGVAFFLRAAVIGFWRGDAEHVVHGSLALIIAGGLSLFTGLGVVAFIRLWRLPQPPD